MVLVMQGDRVTAIQFCLFTLSVLFDIVRFNRDYILIHEMLAQLIFCQRIKFFASITQTSSKMTVLQLLIAHFGPSEVSVPAEAT